MMQLKELFNVNHFIVSHANPHIAPLLRIEDFVRAYGGHFAAKLAHLVEMEVKHRCNQVLELGFPLGGLAKLFVQDWEGDVTVVMPTTLAQYSKIIQNPSHLELQKSANQGRRCTWEKLSAIKANCGIELALDECVSMLNHMRRLKRSAERAAAASHGLTSTVRFNASKRIPSWICIARENSTGSLEEDLLGDVASSIHSRVSGSTTPSGRYWRSFRNTQDGSDSESESVDFNSWTRSGGPLMRTTSADEFIDFIQNLDINSRLNRANVLQPSSSGSQIVGRDGLLQSSRMMTLDRTSDSELISTRGLVPGSSIMVAEGDLLQPERLHNGIVLNVVKKEDLTPSNRSQESSVSSPRDSQAECMQLETPERELDASSAYDDDGAGGNSTVEINSNRVDTLCP